MISEKAQRAATRALDAGCTLILTKDHEAAWDAIRAAQRICDVELAIANGIVLAQVILPLVAPATV